MNVGGQGSRLPGGGGNYPNNLQQVNHRLRAPQNGPHMGMGPPPRYSQPQQNTRPMSHRLGPPNGHGPPNASKSNTNYVKMLEDYFAQMGLGIPEFKTSKMEKKQSNVGGGKSSKKGTTITKYYSTVRVSKESFQVINDTPIFSLQILDYFGHYFQFNFYLYVWVDFFTTLNLYSKSLIMHPSQWMDINY